MATLIPRQPTHDRCELFVHDQDFVCPHCAKPIELQRVYPLSFDWVLTAVRTLAGYLYFQVDAMRLKDRP